MLAVLIITAFQANAGTLTCAVATTCSSGVVLFKMQNTSNSHAGTTSSSYTQLVCCSGVIGLGTDCGAADKVKVIGLSATDNAHIEIGTQTNYANSACLSVPSGGSISASFQASACPEATVASMSTTTTNAHVGNGAAYVNQICASATGASGTLTADIVDGSGNSVGSPTVSMTSASVGFSCQTKTGTFGTSTQKIRVDNSTANPAWTLSVAASATTDLWNDGTPKYDFNDATGSGCTDGADADSYGGQMTPDPSVGTITPKSGCNNTGLSLGSATAFSEGTVNSVTIATAGASAGTSCYWDITGITMSQKIPVEQVPGSYSINYVVSVVAN